MRKTFLTLGALALFWIPLPANARHRDTPPAPGLGAQATSHQVVLNWATYPVANATFNMYRAPCNTVSAGACTSLGTFIKVNGSPITAPPWTDTTSALVAGSSWVYQVTAVCASAGTTPCASPYSGESGPSNQVLATIPTASQPPPPPTGLTLVSVSLNRNGSNATLNAKWIDDPGVDTWQLWNGVNLIGWGSTSGSSGSYALNWNTKINPNVKGFTFKICDSDATCVYKTL